MYSQAVKNMCAVLVAAILGVPASAQVCCAVELAKADTHTEVGPHKGILIELGEEEYHAEFVLDEKTHTVSIFLLDGAVKNYVAIPAKEITVTLKHDGKPESFNLKAKPQKTDAAGTSSMFTLKDKEFVEDLHHKGSDPQLTLKINGKTFTASIKLDHEEEGKPKK